MSRKHAAWRTMAVTPATVFIEDRCLPDCPSITNDAELVVERVLAEHGEKRIVYRDSAGEWAELLHTGVMFRGFAPYTGQVPEWA